MDGLRIPDSIEALMADLLLVELADCTNGYGQPLKDEAVGRLVRLWSRPDPAGWDAAYTLILNARGTTLWQAACATAAIDIPMKVADQWQNVPDRDWLLRAIRYTRTTANPI